MKALELTCSVLGKDIVMSIGATVVSVNDVPAVNVPVVFSSLGFGVTNNVTESSTEVFAVIVPNGVVFAVTNSCTVSAVLDVILEDALKIRFVVVSYTGVVCSIDEETYVSSLDEFVVILDGFDDLLVVVVYVAVC